MTETHTYVTHLQFSARDDAHARLIADKFREVIESWHEFVERDLPEGEQLTVEPQGYVIEAAHLTDADDWAEHVGWADECCRCGKADTNRLRVGSGARWCRDCMDGQGRGRYMIEDVLI